jgi:hypothetical protein
MDFRVNIQGYDISGNIYIDNNKVIVEGDLPFVARLFRGKIEHIIRKQLEEILS